MKQEATMKYYMHNGALHPVNSFHSVNPEGKTIYEVVRVIKGIPLFLEKHLDRLLSSAESIGLEIGHLMDSIKQCIYKTIEANSMPEANLKLVVYKKDSTAEFVAYFIKSTYPSTEQYMSGVPAITFNGERDNPNAKIINQALRDSIDSILAEKNAYEAVLINNKGFFTEGSRSNIFVVKDHKVYTAPAESVLIGITRIYVFELCKALGIDLQETPMTLEFLYNSDGAFITGTSPKILPISSVDGKQLKSAENELIQRLMKAYDNMIVKYISGEREQEAKGGLQR
ncbi:MAG: aminotransferase class IV [Bacillota bacterium]